MPFKRTIRYALLGLRTIQILLLATALITRMALTVSAARGADDVPPSGSGRALMVASVPTLLFEAAALAICIALWIYTAQPRKRTQVLPAVNSPLAACTSYCCDITSDTVLAALYGMSIVLNGVFMYSTKGIGLLLGMDFIMMLLFVSTAVLSSNMGAVMLNTDAMAVPLVQLQDDAAWYVAPGDWQSV